MGRSSNNKTNRKKIRNGGAQNGKWGRHLKTKHRTRDLDQIQDDLARHAVNPQPRKFDQDLPGCGQYYCMVCARYFITDKHLEEHVKSKLHKKRVKLAAEKPYTQEEANAAAGMGATKHD